MQKLSLMSTIYNKKYQQTTQQAAIPTKQWQSHCWSKKNYKVKSTQTTTTTATTTTPTAVRPAMIYTRKEKVICMHTRHGKQEIGIGTTAFDS